MTRNSVTCCTTVQYPARDLCRVRAVDIPARLIRIPCTIDVALCIGIFNHVFIVCCTNENENSRVETLTPQTETDTVQHSLTQAIIAIDQVVLIGLTQPALVVVEDSSRGLVGGAKELNNDRAQGLEVVANAINDGSWEAQSTA